MSDAKHLLEEGRLFQMEQDLAPPGSHAPSMRRWVCLAVVLVLVSLAIELFWPLPHHGPLSSCPVQGDAVASCQTGVKGS